MEKQILEKNHDYSERDGDALSAFKDLAELTGLSPLQCWMVLFGKHLLAVRRYMRSGELKSESIHGRFTDLANYALLGDALVGDLEEHLRADPRPRVYAKKTEEGYVAVPNEEVSAERVRAKKLEV